MTTRYPNGIDDGITVPAAQDNVTPVAARSVNTLREAILAIENELGVDPSREFGTVRARLDAMDIWGHRILFEPIQETLTVTAPGQIVFALSHLPVLPELVEFFIGGIKQEYGIDYTVSGSTLTYLGGTPLILTDILDTVYYTENDAGTIGGFPITYYPVQERLTVTFNGQTVFTLAHAPDVSTVILWISGTKHTYITDYTVVGTTLTWINPTTLLVADTIEVFYFIPLGGGGAPGPASFQSLAQTLVVGNITGGKDIVFTAGDEIIAQADFGVTVLDTILPAGAGGNITIQSGDITNALNVSSAGSAYVFAGNTNGAGNGGSTYLTAGNSTGTGGGGYAQVKGGDSISNSAGYADLIGGNSTTGSPGGAGVRGGNSNIDGGGVNIGGGFGATGNGGSINFNGGSGGNNGGHLNMGAGTGTIGAGGNVNLFAGGGATGGFLNIGGGFGAGGAGGTANVSGGSGNDGGHLNLSAGIGSVGYGGNANLFAGSGVVSSGFGNVNIIAGSFSADIGGNVNITPGAGTSDGQVIIDGYTFINNDLAITGKLTVDGLIDPIGLVIDDQATVPGGDPPVGRATIWYRSTDNTLVGTNSSGETGIIGDFVDHEYWQNQTEWWIDRRTGSDSNDGATALTPLFSHAEFVRRMGWNPRLTKTYIVHIVYMVDVAKTPPGEGLTWEATFVGPTAAVIYQGVLQPASAIKNVGTFVAMSPAGGPNGTEGYFTDSLGANFAVGAVGELVGFDVGGPNPAYSWITYSPGPAFLSARTTVPSYRTGLRVVNNLVPGPGTTYRIYFPPQVNGANLIAHREDTGVGHAPDEDATFIFENISFQNFNSGLTEVKVDWDGEDGSWHEATSPSPAFFGCSFLDRIVNTKALLVGCMFGFQGNPGRTTIRDSSVFLLCHSGGTMTTIETLIGAIDFSTGNSYFDQSGVIFGSGTRFTNSDARSFGIYSTDGNPAITVQFNARMLLDTIWGINSGAGVNAYAVKVDGEAWYSSSALKLVAKGAGTATDCSIGGVGKNFTDLPWTNTVVNSYGGNTASFTEAEAVNVEVARYNFNAGELRLLFAETGNPVIMQTTLSTPGSAGAITILGQDTWGGSGTNDDGGVIELQGGVGRNSGAGGNITIISGDAGSTGNTGNIELYAYGQTGINTGTGNGGNIFLEAGGTVDGSGGEVEIQAGLSFANGNGGNVTLIPGTANAPDTDGYVYLKDANNNILWSVGPNGIRANSNQIHDVVDPTSDQDVATKNYVDVNYGPVTGAAVSVGAGGGYIDVQTTADLLSVKNTSVDLRFRAIHNEALASHVVGGGYVNLLIAWLDDDSLTIQSTETGFSVSGATPNITGTLVSGVGWKATLNADHTVTLAILQDGAIARSVNPIYWAGNIATQVAP